MQSLLLRAISLFSHHRSFATSSPTMVTAMSRWYLAATVWSHCVGCIGKHVYRWLSGNSGKGNTQSALACKTSRRRFSPCRPRHIAILFILSRTSIRRTTTSIAKEPLDTNAISEISTMPTEFQFGNNYPSHSSLPHASSTHSRLRLMCRSESACG